MKFNSIINTAKNCRWISPSTFGITARVAIFLLLLVFLPMIATGVLIEKSMLLPGKNLYLAIPLFFIFLLVPLARFIAYHLINKDLAIIDIFCTEIKKGVFSSEFFVPDQKEDEDTLITLKRSLNWMSRNLQCTANSKNVRLNQLNNDYIEAQKLAFTDPLTGLYNRRYLKDFIVTHCSSNSFGNMSMVYIDCDNFKLVNDVKGHGAGDKLLIWLACCIKESCRVDRDIPLRMGGDEFALLLIDVDLKEAGAISKRIQYKYHLKETYGTTLSIGMADSPCQGTPGWSYIEFLLQQADQQAYVSKKTGGNSICVDNKFYENGKAGCANIRTAQKLANIDPLTGIPNRYLAQERFHQALKRSRRSGHRLCLLFLDLDDFKTINDSLGHHVGDQFLVQIVQSIRDVLRAEDSVCRLGGDQFLILIENITSREDVPPLIMKIEDSIRRGVVIDDRRVIATASIGITLVPDDGEDFDDLCKRAEIALTEAKEKGKNNFCFFDPKMGETVNQSLTLITDLRSAIPMNQLDLYFQPQIDLMSGEISGTEALIRWHHPERGLLSPGIFIPLAERSGQIIEIGYWIIEEACRYCAEWKEAGIEDLIVAINISAVQIKRGNIPEIVLGTLKKYGLEGKNIELEFTESLLVQNDQAILQDFAILREAGIHLAIDDFGTGYSNLNYIKHFNITTLKVDMSFVRGMMSNKQDQAIVEAIINMSKSLELTTVAEGIEDLETMELLRLMQCDTGQGYYWAKPLPASDFLEYYNMRCRVI